ncbi:hypothetical protein WJU23_06470 [Prosthecobacter sp. SYSU 5D2]|uniref:hypothetical protein n=1 Tax=Prosthecobacter sp. SYSU 5D2 TaxID=3134134 RepID=UPI0031FE4DCB
MAKKSPSKSSVKAKKTPALVKPVSEEPGLVAKAEEMVQTVLGTMAGVVEGIGILVTGTEEEKRAKAAAAKKAAKKVAKKSPVAKKAEKKVPVKKATAKAAVTQAPAKKAVVKKAVKKAATKIAKKGTKKGAGVK